MELISRDVANSKGHLRKLFFDVKMKKYVGKRGEMKELSHS